MRPWMLETPPWLIVKSTSLWAGSVAQAEVCAMAMGAASARMPVRIAKRFIVESFRCWAVGPLLGVVERRGSYRMRAETGDPPREIILHNFDAGRLLCVATI